MEILIIGEIPEKTIRWSNLLSTLPSTNVKNITDTVALHEFNLSDFEIVVCIFESLTDSLNNQILKITELNIPVLFLVGEITELSYQYLTNKGVRGLVNSNVSSLSSVKNAIGIVKNGGYYIESPIMKQTNNNKIKNIQSNSSGLDINEWRVFSLFTKDYSTPEISKILDMPRQTVEIYLDKILKNTRDAGTSDAFKDVIVHPRIK